MITKLNIALKLDISEHHWTIMFINDIIMVFVATTTLCSENEVTISLAFPIIHTIINNHFKINDISRSETEQFKSDLMISLANRFKLNSNIETVHKFALFLNPRSNNCYLKQFDINEKKNFITVVISNITENIQIAEIVENAISVISISLNFIFHNLQDLSNNNSKLQIYLQDK